MSTRPLKAHHQMTQLQRRSKSLATVIAAAVTAGLTTFAGATQFVYTPAGTTDQWSTGANWSAIPISAVDTQLTMVGDNNTVITDGQLTTTNNDIAGNFLLNILDLQGTGPATTDASIAITGNPLEFVINGATLPVVNLNANDGAQDLDYSVANNLVLTNNTTVAGNGTSAFAFTGALSSAGSLTKNGTSLLVLSGANTYAGGTTINGGVVTGQ
jgi:autotransporter-associated beta strand protein